MSTDLRNDCVALNTPHRGLTCRLWAHGRPNHWRFTVSVVDARGNLLVFANGGPDDEIPRVAREGDERSLWLRSACIELRGDADALAAERFIAQHARPQIALASGEARLEPASPGL